MLYLVALITAGLGAALIFGGMIAFRKFSSSTRGIERAEKIKTIQDQSEALANLTQYADAYASPAQHEGLARQVQDAKKSIEDQKRALKEVEDALTKAQKVVEEKEVHQQDLKTIREDDEKKLAELLAAYDQISGESIALEQQLAQSLKNLDEMINTVDLNDDQKAVLNQFSESMVSAGSRLRDLITEYEVVRERLEALQSQHKDLEEEYTRLVEQQLGT